MSSLKTSSYFIYERSHQLYQQSMVIIHINNYVNSLMHSLSITSLLCQLASSPGYSKILSRSCHRPEMVDRRLVRNVDSVCIQEVTNFTMLKYGNNYWPCVSCVTPTDLREQSLSRNRSYQAPGHEDNTKVFSLYGKKGIPCPQP